MTMLAEGNSLKDGSNVLAKIAPGQSNGSMCLEREAHMCVQRIQVPSALMLTACMQSRTDDRVPRSV